MKNSYLLTVLAIAMLLFAGSSQAATVVINTGSHTTNQVDAAQAGDTILLAPGIHGKLFVRNKIGTECNPTVVMNQDDNNPGYVSTTLNYGLVGDKAFNVVNSEWVIVDGIQIIDGNNGQNLTNTGIDIQLSKHVIIRNCDIQGMGQAGMKIRWRSRWIDVINNKIHNTGNGLAKYGEGIYLGTAKPKGDEPWQVNGDDANDSCAHVWIEGNEIYDCGNGEGIDFKGDFKYVTVRGNHLHDLYPGGGGQYNEGAISVAGGRDLPTDQPGEFWIENNLIENIYFGNGTGANAAGICTFGGGHYILNNTIGNCEEEGLYFNNYYNYGAANFFVYVHGNSINNNWGPNMNGTGNMGQYVHFEDPGFSNPNSAQTWCGDVANNCPQPDLGEDQSICGVGSVTLDAAVAPNGINTYEWFRNGVSQGNPSVSTNTFVVAQGGTWSVIIDSAGVCSNSSALTIADDIEAFDLGADEDLCSSLDLTLVAGNNNSNYDYSWSKDGVDLGQTSNSITVGQSGTYMATISASGCSDVSDAIVITSSLPTVIGDTICDIGLASLEAIGASSAEWYDAPTDGNMMGTGSSFTPSITQSSTYYVQEGTQSVTQTTGHSSFSAVWSDATYDRKIKFTVIQELTIDAVSLDANGGQNVVVRILASDNSTVLGQYTKSVSGGVDQVNLGITLSPGVYFMDGQGTTGSLQLDDGVTSYVDAGIPGLITYTTEPSWEEGLNRWRYFYNWQVTAGSACVRVPAHAVIDPFHSECLVSSVDDVQVDEQLIYPNPSSGIFHSSHSGEYQVHDIRGELILSGESSEIDITSCRPGVYILKMAGKTVQAIKE